MCSARSGRGRQAGGRRVGTRANTPSPGERPVEQIIFGGSLIDIADIDAAAERERAELADRPVPQSSQVAATGARAHLEQYLDGLSVLFGVAADRFGEPGVLVVPSPDRQGQRLVSHYQVDRHSVFWIDPDLEPLFASWPAGPGPISFEEFGELARSTGATLIGRGAEHLLGPRYQTLRLAPELVMLDGRSAWGIETVRTLLDDCSEDDLDEAEFEIDALDPFLVGWLEGGRLLALAGGRHEPARPGCLDIGVLVHAGARGGGRGRAVVAATVEEILAAGQVPLYRCSVENTGSARLCRSIGFETVLELEAYQWPDS